MAKKAADATEAPAAGGESMTKTEAVKQALAAGVEKPIDGVNWIKEKFGLTMSAAMFSSYKSSAAKKQGPGRPRAAAASAGASARLAVVPSRKADGEDPLALAREVRSLMDRYGAEAVTGMAEILKG